MLEAAGLDETSVALWFFSKLDPPSVDSAVNTSTVVSPSFVLLDSRVSYQAITMFPLGATAMVGKKCWWPFPVESSLIFMGLLQVIPPSVERMKKTLASLLTGSNLVKTM